MNEPLPESVMRSSDFEKEEFSVHFQRILSPDNLAQINTSQK